MKGQVSFELVLVIAAVVALMIPTLFYLFNQANISGLKASSSLISGYANNLVSAANIVYYAGNGSSVILYVKVPRGITNVRTASLENILIVETETNQLTFNAQTDLAIDDAGKLSREGWKYINVSYNGTHAIFS